MFLTASNVLIYLVQKGFASLNDPVSGTFIVEALSRRNRNLHVQVANHHYFVKQVAKWRSSSRSAIDAEACLYRQSQVDDEFAFLQNFVSKCYAYDPDSSVLILEYLTGHNSVFESKLRFDSGTALRIGRFLATFHRKACSPELKQTYATQIPWFFSLHRANEDSLEDSSAGRRDLIRAMRRHREFGRALDRLKIQWQPESLMHADCKLDNWLVDDSGDVRLIDWECIGWGDPAWDMATLMQSYWNVHVRWPHIHSPQTVRPALQAFLRAYGHERPFTAEDLTSRIIPFAGVRMLQSAFESLEKTDNLTPRAIRLSQAAVNIMSRPEWAASYFLGDDWQTLLVN